MPVASKSLHGYQHTLKTAFCTRIGISDDLEKGMQVHIGDTQKCCEDLNAWNGGKAEVRGGEANRRNAAHCISRALQFLFLQDEPSEINDGQRVTGA